MESIFYLVSKIAILLIKCYQCIISPILGSHCRFHLTCSQYSIESIHSFGILKGCFLTFKRLLKCHAFYFSGRKTSFSFLNYFYKK